MTYTSLPQPETTTTPPVQSVHAALAAARALIGHVAKNGFNDHQRFIFRGIDDVVNSCAPAFNKLGIVVTPTAVTSDTGTMALKSGKTAHRVTLTVTYRFYGPQGDYIDTCVMAEAADSGDKATQKAMSVAYRTALLQVLTLPTNEPDPDETTYEAVTADTSKIDELLQSLNTAYSPEDVKTIGKQARQLEVLGVKVNEDDTVQQVIMRALRQAEAFEAEEGEREATSGDAYAQYEGFDHLNGTEAA